MQRTSLGLSLSTQGFAGAGGGGEEAGEEWVCGDWRVLPQKLNQPIEIVFFNTPSKRRGQQRRSCTVGSVSAQSRVHGWVCIHSPAGFFRCKTDAIMIKNPSKQLDFSVKNVLWIRIIGCDRKDPPSPLREEQELDKMTKQIYSFFDIHDTEACAFSWTVSTFCDSESDIDDKVLRDGDSTTSLGSLVQCLTALSVKKSFLISSLNLPWRNLRPFPLAVVESDEVSPQPPFLQAQQPQVPQPLPISLVLQTLPQLCCPSLDMLQPLNVSLVMRGPNPNTGHDCCPSPAGHTISDTSRDAIGLLGHLGTLLAHIQPAVDQHPQVLLCQAAFQPPFPKPVALHGVAVTQVQDPALSLVEPHTIGPSPWIQPVQVPLQSLPTLQQINTPAQLGVICKLTEGALNPLVQITDDDIKQDWPQY
ncbi:hypothetical protein QYF61_011338 [Mycteria americana]|uniref:Uncharacterized protein n=1 Tax=Mycteria americana TaxID=33587 RepID=A0AAN7NCV8_MYCAM|nr:hypothetical protein QYF61_011338 [Mycteria americana]